MINIDYLLNYDIIGLIGEQGAGKSYIASKLSLKFKDYGYESILLSFASPIKYFLANIGVVKNVEFSFKLKTLAEFKDALLKFIPAPELIEEHGNKLYSLYKNTYLTNNERFRFLAQYIGTEIAREYSPNFWVDILIGKLTKVKDLPCKVIIDDIRFISEYKSLYEFPDKKFTMAVISRGNSAKQVNAEHLSEKEWKSLLPIADFDIINTAAFGFIKPRLKDADFEEYKRAKLFKKLIGGNNENH